MKARCSLSSAARGTPIDPSTNGILNVRLHRVSSRAGGLILLGASGAMLLLGLLVLDALSYQLSQQPAFTDLYLQRFPVLQQLLVPLLQVGAPLVPQVAEPRAPAELGEWFAPLAAAWAVGCGITTVGYLSGLWILSRATALGRWALRIVLAFELLFVVTVFVAPGLLSQDIFGYVMYGQVADVHILNPYIWPPSAFAHDPLLQWVAPIWRSLPSPYGPLWTDVDWAMSRLIRDWPVIEQVLAYKVLASALLLLILAELWWLLGRLHTNDQAQAARLAAFTAFAWNPLVLIEIAGNGHNDVLALALLLAGLVALSARSAVARRRYARLLSSTSFFVLSGLVKFLSGIGMVFLLVAAWRACPKRQQRLMLLALTVGWALVLTVVLFAPWLELPDSLDPIVHQTGGNLYANAVPDLLALTVSDQVLLLAGIPLEVARDTSRLVMKGLVDLVFVVYLIWETQQLWRRTAGGGDAASIGIVRASTRASLVLILVVSIWVQPWYFVLPLGLGVLLGVHDALARIAIGYSLTALVGLYVHYYLQDAVSGVIYLAYAGLPILAVVALSRRTGSSPALGSWYDRARHAVGLIDERGQALIPNAARRAAVAELDRSVTDDRARG